MKRINYLGAITIKQGSTEKRSSKEKEDLKRSDPGDFGGTPVLQLIDLVVLLEDSDTVVSDLNILQLGGQGWNLPKGVDVSKGAK